MIEGLQIPNKPEIELRVLDFPVLGFVWPQFVCDFDIRISNFAKELLGVLARESRR
jgi:hypothetical protein